MENQRFTPCDQESCRHHRSYTVLNRDMFIAAFHEQLLWCLTCDRFRGINRYELKRKGPGRPRKAKKGVIE